MPSLPTSIAAVGSLRPGLDAAIGQLANPTDGRACEGRGLGRRAAPQARRRIPLLVALGWTGLGCVGGGMPLSAQAHTFQLLVNINTLSQSFLPAPGDQMQRVGQIDLLNQPLAAQQNTLDRESFTSDGGRGVGRFLGSMGMLEAYAAAQYPYGYDALGHLIRQGYAFATVEARFYDEVAVSGAGLASGAPFSYRVDFSINGQLSSPTFELGGYLSVDGLAEVRLRDTVSGVEVSQHWNGRTDSAGLYSLTLPTQVGHVLALSGMLYAGASVSSDAQTRDAQADLHHSALYSLAPSTAGLNTVGVSGHDFAASVSEPATWAVMLAGLAGLGFRLRRRR